MRDHQDDETRLRALLREDAGSDELAEELMPTIMRLRAWEADLSEAQQVELIARLRAQARSPLWRRLAEWWPLLILRSQARIIQREIWVASLLMTLLGLGITLAVASPGAGAGVFVLIAPVIAASGIAFLYNEEIEGMLEIEHASQASLRLVLLARMVLVFGWDMALGVIASLIAAIARDEIAFGLLVSVWFVPMFFLSSLAFCVAVIGRDSIAGMMTSLTLWVVFSLWRVTWQPLSLAALWLPGAAPWLVGAATAIGAASIWLVGSRTIRRRMDGHVA